MPFLHEITTDLVDDKAMVVCINAGGWGLVPVVAEDPMVVDVGGPGVGRGEGGGEQAGYCQEAEEEEHDGTGRVTLSFQDPLQVYIATRTGQDGLPEILLPQLAR